MNPNVYTLLSAVATTGAGSPVKVDPNRVALGGPIPIQISGVTTATVVIQATLASAQAVREGTATWENITDASWTADCLDVLSAVFPWIRANVTAFTSGTITVKAFI
jgi:hypothetical protein